MNKAKKLLALLLALVMVCTCLSACGSSSSSSDSSSTADSTSESTTISTQTTEAGTLTVGIVNATQGGFDHVGTHGQNSDLSIKMCWSGLFRRNDDTGELENDMVDTYEWIDSTHLKITLKEGITASNGEEITGEDVIYSYQRYILEESNLSTYFTQYDFDNCYVDENDPLTFVLAYYEEYGPGISAMDSPIYPMDWCESEAGQEDATWWDSPNSTGPYVCVENVDGSHTTFQLRDDYWGDTTGMAETITIKFYSEESTMYIDFVNGDIDACYGLSSSDAETLSETEGVVLKKLSTNNVLSLVLPETIEYFDDIYVRMAVAHCIDYEAVCIMGYDDLYTLATSILPSTVNYYENVGGYEYDLELAKEYMAQSAYPDGFELDVTITNGTVNVNVMTAIQSYLAEIGITMTFNAYDIPTAVPIMQAGETGLALNEVQGGASSRDPSIVLATLNAETTNMSVIVTDELYNEYYQIGQNSVDEDARAEAYANLQERIKELYRILPIAEATYAIAYHDYISFAGGATPSAPDLTQVRFA